MSRPGEPIVVIGAKLVYATTYNQFVPDFSWVSSKSFDMYSLSSTSSILEYRL